jgi:hypothetical protein
MRAGVNEERSSWDYGGNAKYPEFAARRVMASSAGGGRWPD